jgi:hypothetical protein
MKVDFRKIRVRNIEGEEEVADISKTLGNILYMNGQDIEECELGKAIYHDGEVELNEKAVETVRRFAKNFSYLMRSSIENACK